MWPKSPWRIKTSSDHKSSILASQESLPPSWKPVRVVKADCPSHCRQRPQREAIFHDTGFPINSASGHSWNRGQGSQKKLMACLDFTLIPRVPWQLTLVICICSCFTAFVLPSAESGGGTDELPKAGCAGRVLELCGCQYQAFLFYI